MKKQKQVFRSLIKDNNATLHLSRLLAITIPFLFITGLHVVNELGLYDVPEFLLDAVFGFYLIAMGVLIAILGLSINMLTWFLIGGGLLLVCLYMYLQYVINII